MRVHLERLAAGWACLLLALPPVVHADEASILTLEQVRALAQNRALSVIAARSPLEIATANRNAARMPAHDPELSLEAGPRQGASTPDMGAALSWTLEPPGARRARARAATLDLEARTADLEATQREAVAQALERYFRALHAQRTLELWEAQLAEDGTSLVHARSRQARGDLAAIEVELLEAEQDRDRASLARARAEASAQTGLLELALGDPPPFQLPAGLPAIPGSLAGSLPGALPSSVPGSDPALTSSDHPALTNAGSPALTTSDHPALTNAGSPTLTTSDHPALKVLDREAAAASARVEEARRNRLPSPTLSASVRREELTGIALLGVSVPLALPGRSRAEQAKAQAGDSLAREALRGQTRRLEAALRAANARAAGALEAVTDLEHAEARMRKAHLRLTQAWQAGDRNVLEVLQVQREAISASRARLDGWLEAALAVVEVKTLTGGWQ